MPFSLPPFWLDRSDGLNIGDLLGDDRLMRQAVERVAGRVVGLLWVKTSMATWFS